MKMSLRGSIATAAILLSLVLAACGDSSTSSDDFSDSSSSVIPGTDPESGSSSSSVIPGTDPESGSSSSSVIPGTDLESSSGTSEEESSSSEQETTCNGVVYDATTHFCASRKGTEERAYRFVTITNESRAYSKKWMAENLNFKTNDSYCYENEGDNCVKYGRLYTWSAATSACPDGWHLPSKTEWEKLFDAVGGKSTAGQKLKAKTGWATYNGITNKDTYGFAALPAGRNNLGRFGSIGEYAYFWSATQRNDRSAHDVDLDYGKNSAIQNEYSKSYGFSVRCLQN